MLEAKLQSIKKKTLIRGKHFPVKLNFRTILFSLRYSSYNIESDISLTKFQHTILQRASISHWKCCRNIFEKFLSSFAPNRPILRWIYFPSNRALDWKGSSAPQNSKSAARKDLCNGLVELKENEKKTTKFMRV